VTRKVRPLLPAAEAALIGVSLATVAGFWRLFNTGSFFPQLAVIVIVAHFASIITRRLGWGVPSSAAVAIATMVATVGVVLYGSTTYAGLPSASTLQAASGDLHDVWHLFESVQAPTAASRPFLLLAALGLWWAAFVADWAAFRLWVPFEAILPAGTVFVFSSLFASQRGQVAASAMFLMGAFAFLLLHRVTRQQSSAGWVSSDVQRGTNSLLRAGAALAALAVLAAIIIGPNLPQARSEALVGWRNGEGEGPNSRTTVSPFVDIRKRLVDQSNLELFTVQSQRRSYWRLTSLDRFDGNVWSSNGAYERATGSLPHRVPSDVNTVLSQQTFSVSELDTIWLPAAFEPRGISAGNTTVRYEPDSSTLIVGTNLPNSNGLNYVVQSALPTFDPTKLSAATAPPPAGLEAEETQLPATLDPRVRQEAERVVAGATTPYAKALALQDYFRNNFTYDLSVPPGQSDNAIVDFLFVSKRGYCEQFAGTYAAMARSIGLPTRVAVGFTPGDEDPNRPGTYHVRGLYAHAWPEVFITGQGWVPFEPTPTRGAPNAEQYTHVPEQQATPGGGATTVPTSTVDTTPTTSASAATTTPRNELGADDNALTTVQPSFWSTRRFGGRALIVGAALLVLAVIYVIVVPLAYGFYRRRRRKAATEPDAQVRLAWQESVEAAQTVGVSPWRSETAAEFGHRADKEIGAQEFPVLAGLVSAANYSVDGVDEEQATTALELSDEVATTVRGLSTRQQRVMAALDPRPPDRRRPVARHHHIGPGVQQLPAIEIVRVPSSQN
jgi:transglutaminase-like putative cysteine protease